MEEQHTDLTKAVTRVGSSIVIALPAELTDDRISGLQKVITESAYDFSVTGAILNFARVVMMDSYIFNEMRKISKTIALMGVRVVWAGLNPGVICALVDSGVPLNDKAITAVSSLDQGLALLGKH